MPFENYFHAADSISESDLSCEDIEMSNCINGEAHPADDMDFVFGKNECYTQGNNKSKNVAQSLSTQLIDWSLKHNIAHVAINDLLNVLKPFHPELPLDVRTLLQTPKKKDLININPGEYYHFGLESCVKKLLIRYPNTVGDLGIIQLLINIDGLPLSKSSGSQLYPILCSLYEYRKKC
ncbi:hypothetical protein NQ314_012466 [Rhamnusium bicolor]|uniref:Uncharacterized protein n=1 Tax=Rhamnusium bicolor TaxID=1586634 RepID=A0AAV8XC88_9CUCU|nr:hypothetical protein NQ314_012466 [Rhamnusium bicolor]